MELVHQLLERVGAHVDGHDGGDLAERLDARLAHTPDLVASQHLEDGQQLGDSQLLAHGRSNRADAQRRRLAHAEGGVVGEGDDLG